MLMAYTIALINTGDNQPDATSGGSPNRASWRLQLNGNKCERIMGDGLAKCHMLPIYATACIYWMLPIRVPSRVIYLDTLLQMPAETLTRQMQGRSGSILQQTANCFLYDPFPGTVHKETPSSPPSPSNRHGLFPVMLAWRCTNSNPN